MWQNMDTSKRHHLENTSPSTCLDAMRPTEVRCNRETLTLLHYEQMIVPISTNEYEYPLPPCTASRSLYANNRSGRQWRKQTRSSGIRNPTTHKDPIPPSKVSARYTIRIPCRKHQIQLKALVYTCFPLETDALADRSVLSVESTRWSPLLMWSKY